MAQSRPASAQRSQTNSPASSAASAASAAFLDVAASQPRSIHQSGTQTPNQSPQSSATQIFHMTVTLPTGDVVDGDFIYRSHPGTLPGTLANSPNPASFLASRHRLPPNAASEHSLLAAAISTALGTVEPDSERRPANYAATLEDAERGEANHTDVNEADDATAPLLQAPAPARQKKPAPSCTANFVSSIGSSIYHVVTHPVSSSLAVVTAAPTTLNALATPSGMGPDKLGKEWWNSMSGLARAHSLANGASSLVINTIMNALFLPTAWQKFRDSIMHLFDSIGEFLDNSSSIILAIGGAFAAAVIAYNAFLWLPAGTFSAIIPAALAFVITMAQRYVGVKNVIRRFRNLFNEDARTQQELADIAQHINPQYLEEIQARFNQKLLAIVGDRTGEKPLTDNEREKLLIGLSDILSEMQRAHPDDLIKDTSTLEYITRYSGILFDMVFAVLVIAPPSLLTHMQKGFDGVNTISRLTTDHPLPLPADMHTLCKCLIGIVPGLASALLYANSALDIRTTLVDMSKHLYQNPRNIPFALTLLIANGFASGGIQNVAMGVVANPDNLAHLSPGTPLSTIYVATQTLGGGVVNSNASITRACLSAQAAAADVTVKNMANYAARTNERVISHATGERLRSHALFTKRRAAEAAAKEEYQHQPAGPAFV